MRYVIKAFFRSFLIQSSWNFERMQNLGFLYSIAPAIGAIKDTESSLKSAYKRHLEFFNTNPYLAPAIVGAVIRLEEEGASDEEIRGLKTALMGPYGAIGDSLFWGALRPFAAVIGVLFAVKGRIWAPLIFLAVYNIPHIVVRIYGMFMGYKTGMGVINAVKGLNLPDMAQKIKGMTLFASGFLLSIVFSMTHKSGESGHLGPAFIVLSALGFFWGLEKGIRVEALAFLAVGASVVLGLFL